MDTEKANQALEVSTAPATGTQASAVVSQTDEVPAIYNEEDEEGEQEKSLDLTAAHFKYTKLRSAFGKQPQFLEDRPRIHCGLRANTTRYHPHFQQQSKVDKAEDTLQALRELSTNVGRAEYRTFSVLHTEGGWPKEVNIREPETVEKTRRKLQREESFIDAVPNLAREAEILVKHNNTLGLCEPLNKRPYVQKRDTKPYASVITVYKCPSRPYKRPVSKISFAPGNAGRMAVAYCPYEFDPTFREHSCEAFFWEINNPTRPEGLVRSAAQIVDVKYHPIDVHSICGALFTGQVCTWDNRVGPTAQAISKFEVSHADVCTNAVWSNGDGGSHEFFSAGLDGEIIWWDERNLSDKLSSVYADVVVGRNDPKNAVPVTVLEYDHNMKNNFIVGTQFGQVMTFAKEEKRVKKKKKSSVRKVEEEDPRMSSKVPSLFKIHKEEGDEEDEEEEEEEEEQEEEEEEEEEQKEEEEEEEEGHEEEEEDEREYDEEEEGDEEEEDEGPHNVSDQQAAAMIQTPPEAEQEQTVLGPFELVTVYAAHRAPVTSVKRNPAFPSNFMSCGGYNLRFYSEEVLESGIMWTSPGEALFSYCDWLRGRPSCLVASRIDGCLEFWDLLIQGSSSILTTKICEEPLSFVCPSDNRHHIAAGTVNGDIRMVQVCPFLASFDDSDRDNLGQLFHREARREQFLAERMRAAAKQPTSDKKPAPSKQAKEKASTPDTAEKVSKKPDPYKNPEIFTDKKFFDMLAEEKKRQGVNAFPDKKQAAEEYSKKIIEGRMDVKKNALQKANKRSDSELGAQQLMDVNETAIRQADELFEEGDEEFEEEDEEEVDASEVRQPGNVTEDDGEEENFDEDEFEEDAPEEDEQEPEE